MVAICIRKLTSIHPCLDEHFTCVVMELLDPKPLFAHKRFAHVKELKTRIPGTYEVKSRQLCETLDDIRKGRR